MEILQYIFGIKIVFSMHWEL